MADRDADRFDPEILRRIRQLLSGVDDLWSRRAAAVQAPVVAGSLAAADAALPEARFVSIYATQTSSTALDHLNAWRLLANGPAIPIGAHITLLRGALESAVRCRWHVDAAADAGTRVGRGHAARRADQSERGKFEASRESEPRPPLPVGGQTAAQRIAALDDPEAIAQREAAGVRSVGFTDTTGLMIAYGYERWFRLMSGLAHGKEWALAATHLERSAGPPLAPKVRHGTFSASEPIALALTVVAFGAVRAAVADLEAYRAAAADEDRP